MKRFLFFLLALCLLTVQAFAVSVESDCFYYDSSDGYTHFGVIAASEMDSEIFGYYQDWLQSDRRLLLCNSSGTVFTFYNLYDTADVTLTYPWLDSSGVSHGLGVNCSGADIDENVGVSFSLSLGDDGLLHFDGDLRGDDNCPLCGRYTCLNSYIVMCSSSLLNEISFPSPTSDYVVDFQGNLAIEDDLDDSGGSDDNDDSEQSGILGFLNDFWNTFKNFLLGLFVPSDGYFSSWYQEVKVAFDEKLGAITSLYEQLTGFFNGIKIAEHTIMCENFDGSTFKLFNDSLFGDIFGFLKPVITGFLVLCCWLFCYRKIIGFVQD